MVFKYTLENLTQDFVHVKKQEYIEIEGNEYPINDPFRRAYLNSVRGRSEVEHQLPNPQKEAIFAVWGGEPTVVEEDV